METDTDRLNREALGQLAELRRAHPGTVILFRIGEWFRAFNEDAKTLHKVCGVGLAEKRLKKVKTYSASIPFARVGEYADRLVDAGHAVKLLEPEAP